ncbi:MAG: transketolase C-terminal domain-containing protein, partial [Chloroflexota bacterium]
MISVDLIPQPEFERIHQADFDPYTKLQLLADMCRFNTLAVVKRAGSGHLGTCLSSMDIVTLLYYKYLNVLEVGINHPDRDVYFSSKGHDVPGLYSVFYALGILDQHNFVNLRRIDGLHGHPFVEIDGIESNSGSLGMGISKAKGVAFAKKVTGRGGRVFVVTGDGELQEGQIYESLQTAAHQKITNLIAIVDNNKIQSDKPVEEIISLGDMEAKFEAFGWHVATVDGHNMAALDAQLSQFLSSDYADRPKIIIADTRKGRGISFMEYTGQLDNGVYRWHSGAPADGPFREAQHEILGRIQAELGAYGIEGPRTIAIAPPLDEFEKNRPTFLGESLDVSLSAQLSSPPSGELVTEAFGRALVTIGVDRQDLVVLDADLAGDTRIRQFEEAYPERFLENGIAEQDMVSAAGGMARHGLLPVVSSFAGFMVARANEQIYNNATEGTKIIYACQYAGLFPSGPGFSHQSVRDISLLGALPNCIILQPCSADETEMVARYCVYEAEETCAVRLILVPSPRKIKLPANYQLTFGQGVTLHEGQDAALFAHGPIMVHHALLVAEILAKHGFKLKVINMPWLNRLDKVWFLEAVKGIHSIYTLEDHAATGGLGFFLQSQMMRMGLKEKLITQFAIEEYPACGTTAEV